MLSFCLRFENLAREALRYGLIPKPHRSPEDEALRQQLIGLLTVHNGNVFVMSRASGIRRPQIYRLARRLDIDLAEFRR